MKGVVAAGHPVTAQAGVDALEAGGNAVDAAVACVLMSFVAESLLTGPGAGGFMLVHAGEGEDHLLDFFVSAPGHGLDGRTPADLDPGGRPLLRGRRPGVQRRALLLRGLRHHGRPGRGAVALRHHAALRSHRGPGRRRAPGGGGRAHAGPAVQGAGADRALHTRVRGDLRPRGQHPPCGRHDPASRAGRPAGPPRRRGPGLPLRGRARRPHHGLGARARRAADVRGPAPLPGGGAQPGAGELPRPRGAHQSAALLRRHPDRGRARHPRAARPAARRGGGGRGDRLHQPRPRRRLPRRPGQPRLPGGVSGSGGARHGGHGGALPAREHHPHLGDGRRRPLRHA